MTIWLRIGVKPLQRAKGMIKNASTLQYQINVALFLLIFSKISCATFISLALFLFIFQNLECATFIWSRYICLSTWYYCLTTRIATVCAEVAYPFNSIPIAWPILANVVLLFKMWDLELCYFYFKKLRYFYWIFWIVNAQLLLDALFLLKFYYYDRATFIRCATFIR